MNASTHTKLVELQEKAFHKIQRDEATFHNRSERWQNSSKGEEYFDKINTLQEYQSNLGLAITSLNHFLDL